MNERIKAQCANTPPKRVAAIHDLSCFGRCALTVIIPTLSAMGHQVVPIPTALLSTHTGGFDRESLYFLDLTEQMHSISEHLFKIGVTFDAIYTGFLGSERQIVAVEDIIDRFACDTCPVIVDPVMGDDGVLYSTYNDALVEGIKRLCHSADIITPNLTEACLLTGTEYRDTSLMNEDAFAGYVDGICSSLVNIYGDTVQSIVVTGIHKGEDSVLTVVCSDGQRQSYEHSRLKKGYPGTGDIFASVLLGDYLVSGQIYSATKRACDFVADTIEYTASQPTPIREGVSLEPLLHLLGAHADEA